SVVRQPPLSPLLPYTTLFRSGLDECRTVGDRSTAPLGSAQRCNCQHLAGRHIEDHHVATACLELLDRPRECTLGDPLQFVVDGRSEEHTSELQSRENLVCRLL